MKRQLAAFAVAILLLVSQITLAQFVQAKNASGQSMRGAYTMTKQVMDTGMGPSVLNTQQMKLFTDKYVMYAHRRSDADSMADFGVGTYKVENGKVIESMFFTQEGPAAATYELAITPKEKGYSQFIDFPGQNGHFLLTEDYINSSKKMTSPLDGAWKLTKMVWVDKEGKESSLPMADAAEYKFYESGHFMWANRWKDEKSGKFMTGYGYGTFQMNGPGKSTETNISSTYASSLVGKPMSISLKFMGTDRYEQVFTNADGSKQIETYERMK